MLKKIKSIFNSKKGEGEYFAVAVSFICLLVVLVFTINVYSFFTLKDDMNELAEQLVNYAGVTGSVGPDFEEVVAMKRESFPYQFSISTAGTDIYPGTVDQIDRGDKVVVSITVIHHLSGMGIANDIPIPCTVQKTSISTRTSLGYIQIYDEP